MVAMAKSPPKNRHSTVSKEPNRKAAKAKHVKPAPPESSENLRSRLSDFCRKFAVDLVQSDPVWDRDLDKSGVLRSAPEHKGKRVLFSFVRKVGLVIDMIDDPNLRDAIPGKNFSTRTALRRWHDIDRKLWPWSVPDIDSPDGTYGDLCEIYEDAELALDHVRKGKKFELSNLLAEKDQIIEGLRREMGRKEKQNLDLMDQLNRAINNAGKTSTRR
ncbi:hypothetical protein [Rhizobium rhizogenes]|uniref:hypothetical protein n=1 Tax=Rhizobium rhizogenes TaxID=359 RepID=UPI001571E9CB|nr:hypothetical protein [Rhizobium rhizogenes]NTF49051.1 hypothetical protein [Rhizobium rhizogenes]NTH06435.1 hypothetical protein [Rhizobium rhizogenes]